ncbi:MAG: efflux RND transporter permease subunit [Cryobacterium sp.]|nr:efflux RND transporter permease subunit [Oligoflexia bacterium]
MDLAKLSISRPTFITCVIILMLSVGLIAISKLGVDLFPDVTFPVVTVTTIYPGAAPNEVETLVSKPLEDEISTISGIKRLSSINQEGVSQVVAEFTLKTDVKIAEQQVRDRVSAAKSKFPDDITEEPVIRRIDPADLPVITLSLSADLPPAKLYDLANEFIRPRFEQVSQVGKVEVWGGRKREIHVKLDRTKLNNREISASQVVQRLKASGENVPVGKDDRSAMETVYRSVGQFSSVKDISSTIVNFLGNDIPTTIDDVGKVEDTLVDETMRSFINGKKSVFIVAYKQSGSNTIAVVRDLKKRVDLVNALIAKMDGHGKVEMVRDSSIWIDANVEDVKETIFIGIALAVIVVFFFLGSGRSTIITGLALPNSLIGAFILMAVAGFTINIMTLLALSISVGLLIDDAIVVRENIFRHIEMGKSPMRAAIEGTAEVRLAVIATTLAVIAVFAPVGFIPGVIGQFLREFGLTVCFAMAISLFDALTIAPMLSAYFAGKVEHLHDRKGPINKVLQKFDLLQTWLENKYEAFVHITLKRPLLTLGVALVVSLGSCAVGKLVPSTFIPPQDSGEFQIGLDMPPGTGLDKMNGVAKEIDEFVRSNKEVELSSLTIGSNLGGEANTASMYIRMVPRKQRDVNTIVFKERMREALKKYAFANPIVKDFDAIGGGQRPFNLNIMGNDMKVLEEYTKKLYAYVRKSPALKDVDTNYRSGKPELQIVPNKRKMEALGISSIGLGQELRSQIEGTTAAKFRENGVEYDIRVRLEDDQRNLEKDFGKIRVPNINGKLIPLQAVAQAVKTTGPTKINRQDRNRYIQINGDNAPGGDLNKLISDLENKMANDPELKLPTGYSYAFIGQAENFQEMQSGIAVAMGLGVLFIYLVLASLYESFVTPFTIMLAMPLAFCGSLVALAVSHESLNLFSMIGMVMLMGVSAKNSILLVDYANHQVAAGKTRAEAMIIAGRTRLRPILMTTIALIAGMIPLAIGLNEASKQRTSMGWAIIGGLISSTVLTLIVVPAAYIFIDRFRAWSLSKLKHLFGVPEEMDEGAQGSALKLDK